MTKNWKKTGYLIPDVIEPEDNICICVPVPKDWGHINAFLGQITELAKWLTWEKDGTDSAIRSARRWMEITQCVIDEVNCIMSTGCGCGGERIPTNQRYTEDGHLEVSYDGGVTWENADGIDPRFNSPIFSPLPGADGSSKRCKGANSVVTILKDEQAKSSAILDAATGITALITAVAGYVAGTGVGIVVGVVIALMSAILTAIINAGETTFTASFGGTTWDDLLCILFCEMEDDGTFTEAGWESVVSQANTLPNYPANEWLSHMIKVIGPVGLTNASLTGAPGSLSCDGCDCADEFCYLFNFTFTDGDWQLWERNSVLFGQYDSPDGWVTSDATAIQAGIETASREVRIQRVFTASELTRIVVTYDFVGGAYDNSALTAMALTVGASAVISVARSAMIDGTNQVLEWTNLGTNAGNIGFSLRSSRDTTVPLTYNGSARILSIQVEGRGNNPFGVDNCP